MDMFVNTVELKSAFVSQMMLTLMILYYGWLASSERFPFAISIYLLNLSERPKAWSEFPLLTIETSFSMTCIIFHQDLFAKHLEVSHCFIFLMC
jgi:hypothetical protein